jgi:hypothetical protein
LQEGKGGGVRFGTSLWHAYARGIATCHLLGRPTKRDSTL